MAEARDNPAASRFGVASGGAVAFAEYKRTGAVRAPPHGVALPPHPRWCALATDRSCAGAAEPAAAIALTGACGTLGWPGQPGTSTAGTRWGCATQLVFPRGGHAQPSKRKTRARHRDAATGRSGRPRPRRPRAGEGGE